MKNRNLYIGVSFAALFYLGCKPRVAKDQVLPSPEPAAFEMYRYDDPKFPEDKNTYIFRNTTPNGFRSSWDFGGVAKSTQDLDTIFFAFPGQYKIKLISASKGGYSTTEQTLTIAEKSVFAAEFDAEKVDEYRYRGVIKTPANAIKSVKWTISNGITTSKADTTIYFPWKGKYTMTLDVNTIKGPSSITKEVEVTQDDPTNPDLVDPVFLMLTGGPTATNGKTWQLVNFNGVGPKDNNIYNGTTEVAWYKHNDGINSPAWQNGGAANDYTFNIKQYQFTPKNTKATVHWAAANMFFGKNQPKDQDIALEDPKLVSAPFVLKRDPKVPTPSKYGLTIGNGSHLGYMHNRSYYEIVKISNDSLYIRLIYDDRMTNDPAEDGAARYFTYVAKK